MADSKSAARHYRLIVALFGLFWLANAWFQFSGWVQQGGGTLRAPLLDVLAKAVKVAPVWLQPAPLWFSHVATAIDPQTTSLILVAIDLALGLALLSRRLLVPAGWLGFVYSLFCWVTIGALGYPYGGGQTDPGVFPAYAIAFLFVLAVAPAIAPDAPEGAQPCHRLWRAGSILFALLWCFDAALKWMPGFLFHFMDQLTPAVQGQPAWIVAYIGLIITVVRAVGPTLVAVVVAVAETALGLSLLSGVLASLSIPLGFLYSLAVWSSAEGFGGPYGPAGTGVRGDVLGNVLIYALVFLFLAVGRSRPQDVSAA